MSLTRPDPKPLPLKRDPHFQPCTSADGDELYPNGIFEFNISRLREHIEVSGRHDAISVPLEDLPHVGGNANLNEQAIGTADLRRPVIFAEIAPARYNLIDGHHRVAKARRDGVHSIPAFYIRCPEHVAFLTSVRAYEAYLEYWNSKIGETERSAPRPRKHQSRRSGG